MKQSQNNQITADLVYENPNQNQNLDSMNRKISTITFSTPFEIPKNKNDQEQIFMEALIQEDPLLEITKRENVKPIKDLPKSCFKIFKDGLINNLIEIAKCIGAKR
jgi:hypothetical protein